MTTEVTPPHLYKFMARHRADELAMKGSIRLGTLEGFQKEEAYNPGIGDAGEGVRTHVSGPLWSNRGDVDVPGLKIVGVPHGMIQFSNVAFVNQTNALIYCLAEHTLATGFGTGYDTIVEVSRPHAFVDAITVALVKEFPNIRPLGLVKCNYDERESQLDQSVRRGDDSWFRKPLRFASQAEYRAGWWRPDLGTEPVYLNVPEICELVRILPTESTRSGIAQPSSADVADDPPD